MTPKKGSSLITTKRQEIDEEEQRKIDLIDSFKIKWKLYVLVNPSFLNESDWELLEKVVDNW